MTEYSTDCSVISLGNGCAVTRRPRSVKPASRGMPVRYERRDVFRTERSQRVGKSGHKALRADDALSTKPHRIPPLRRTEPKSWNLKLRRFCPTQGWYPVQLADLRTGRTVRSSLRVYHALDEFPSARNPRDRALITYHRLGQQGSEHIQMATRSFLYTAVDFIHLLKASSGGIMSLYKFSLQATKGVIVDPTIRFEMHEQQPQEVCREKQVIYEPCCQHLGAHYHITHWTVLGSCSVPVARFHEKL
ncbi:hypothetical protein ANN_20244 [Periplaneta americana]|uniref:Uncharacterized protein n=1 Tax=Periplaneta americana TaxID=6978 RepID=A0ABQ8SCT4_PERAM|nr:hypothetical protein ANN_20244 [Periplaneta americana]